MVVGDELDDRLTALSPLLYNNATNRPFFTAGGSNEVMKSKSFAKGRDAFSDTIGVVLCYREIFQLSHLQTII